MDLYAEVILDHYKNPRNFGELKNPDIKAREANPLCGDVVEIHAKLDKEHRVKDVKFHGEGCAISQASASMLTEMIKGKKIEDIRKLGLQDMLDALKIQKISPARVKCLLLPIITLKAALGSQAPSFSETSTKDNLS